MAIKQLSRINGSVHDLERVLGLSADDCHVLLVSSRTLYLLANFATSDVRFVGRYFRQAHPGGLIDVVEPGDMEEADIALVANQFGLEVQPVTCDLVQAINNLTVVIQNSSSMCDCVPNGPNPPQPPVVEGEPPPAGYREYDVMIDDRKCKLANMAVDDLLQVIELLIQNDVSAIASLGVGAMSSLWALIVGLIASGPVAWALAGLGTIASVIGFFLVNSLDLSSLKGLIEANREDLVCELYLSGSNGDAFTGFKSILSGVGATAVDLLFLDTLNFIDGLTTVFFAPDEAQGDAIEARLATFVPETACDPCGELISDWVIAPSGLFFNSGEGGFMGTGTILQDGSQFVIDAVPQVGVPGNYILGIMHRAYLDDLGSDPDLVSTLTETVGGAIEIVTNPPNTVKGRARNDQQCGQLLQNVNPPITPGIASNRHAMRWIDNNPFSITFSVVSPAAECFF